MNVPGFESFLACCEVSEEFIHSRTASCKYAEQKSGVELDDWRPDNLWSCATKKELARGSSVLHAVKLYFAYRLPLTPYGETYDRLLEVLGLCEQLCPSKKKWKKTVNDLLNSKGKTLTTKEVS
jgi:hypothetical protein